MIQTKEYGDFSRKLHTDAGHKPVVGQFELTYGCGLKCAHCYTDCYNTPEDRRREMTTAEALAIADKIAEGGCFWLCLTGGDPLAHHGFKEIYLRAKQHGLLVTIFTTGTSMTPAMADLLAANPPFNIEVTIHGTTAEVYESVTQRPGSFERFQRGIRLIMERGLPLKLKTVAMRQNVGELATIKAFVESLGKEFMMTTTIHARLNGDTTPGSYQLSAEEVLSLRHTLRGEEDSDRGCRACAPAMDDALEAFLQPVDPTNRLFRCGIGYDSFWVDPYGRMILCSSMREPSYNLLAGTLQEGFDILAHGIRERTFQGDSECTHCTLWNRCVKCPGKAYLETGNPEGDIDRLCQLTHWQAQADGVRHPEDRSWHAIYEEKRARRAARRVATGAPVESFVPLTALASHV